MKIQQQAHGRSVVSSVIVMLAARSLAPNANAALDTANARNVSVVVRYGDLNIDSTAGRSALLRRINNAANRVCTVANYYERPWLRTFEHCKRKSLKDALAQLDAA